MALTVVKYSKTPNGGTIAETNQAIIIRKKPIIEGQYIIKKPIKLEGGGVGSPVILNKIPAIIKPANQTTIKRVNNNSIETANKFSKFSLQATAHGGGTSLANFHWQPSGGSAAALGSGTSVTIKKEQIGQALSSLPPNTIIQTKTVSKTEPLYKSIPTNPVANVVQKISTGTTIKPVASSTATTLSALSSQGTTVQIRKPAFVIKRAARSIKSITLDLIEKNPETHLGLSSNRLPILKNVICPTTGVSLTDCYLVLKKLKLNEDFSLLAEYFEMTVEEVHHVFTKALVQLARYLRFLIKFSDKNYYERHKDIPIAYRSKLSNVQSLIECVETDIEQPENSQYECKNYKFILSISTNDIISYVSDVYLGNYDDVTIFKSSNFKDHIPKHLTLFCDPAKGIRQKKKTKRKKSPSQTNGDKSKDEKETQDSSTDSAEESTDESIDTNPQVSRTLGKSDNSKTSQAPNAESINPELVSERKSNSSLEIVKNQLKSKLSPSISIPTTNIKEPLCRQQISNVIDRLRTFKILQNYGIHEPMLYQYLSEIVVVVAALFNLQR